MRARRPSSLKSGARAMDDADDDADLVGSSSSAADHLPLAAVAKLAKESMPDGLRCGTDVPLLLQACISEFVQMLTAQANEKASAEKKGTINEAHIRKALEELGQAAYIPQASSGDGDAADDGKGGGGKRRRGGKLKRSGATPGLSEEELLRMQQELFASARASQGLAVPAVGDADASGNS